MQKEFVTYKIALKLKELGFDEPCFGFWNVSQINNSLQELKYGMCVFKNTSTELSKYPKNVLAPLYQQVTDWFREKHNLHISVLPFKLNDKYDDVKLCWYYVVIDINRDGNITLNADSLNPSIENFNSYEEAREQAILKVIELCQKEK